MVDEENTQYDVKVINAFKSYGENNVINGLNMNIKSGSIYGLLGPSGCGKSTLLQCILGIIPLDSGCIDLKLEHLVDIGYMPQDLCLDNTLTVQETFDYYGSLYGMDKKKINNRIDELSNFLQLPNTNSYIKDISGGQCRRVSLAISLFHDPKVIILDEPTVGIDPLLRHNIWAEFKKLVEQYNKTIIITTHYIEEANMAEYVGLMRNGKLIEEGSPQNILCKYNTNSLESAFLRLCYNREINQIDQNDVHDAVRVKNETKYTNLRKHSNKIDYTRIKALMRKNIRLLSRDYFLMFTMFILPIFQSYNFCAGIGVDIKGKSIAIKNDEINYLNCQWSNVNGCILDEGSNQKMSCVITNYFVSQQYKLIQVNDSNDVEMMMKDANHVAFIHFPKNYTKELVNFIDDRDNYDVKMQPYIHFTRHNVLIKNQFVVDVMNAMDYLLNKTLNGCSNNPKSLQIPMEFNAIVGSEVKSYSNSLISIYTATIALYLPSIFSISVMLSERMDGILSRSMFAGVTALDLLVSMFCLINAIIVIQTCIPLFVIYVLFSNPVIISSGIFAYFLMIILLGWIGFFSGLLAAGLLTSKIGGVYIINGWLISQFLLSGVIWPVEGQSLLLQKLSKILPMHIAGKMMTDITLKGWTLDHPSVVMGTTIIFVYVTVIVLILIVLGKFKKDMWVIHK